MKKAITFLMTILMVLSFMACAGGNQTSKVPATEVTALTTTNEPTPEPTPDPTPEPTPKPTPEPTPQTIFDVAYDEPITIMDNEYVLVQVVSRYEDRSFIERSVPPFYNLGFKIYVENKTDNYYITVSFNNVSINGMMNDGFYGGDYVSPQTAGYSILKFNRLVEDDGSHPNVETIDDMINIKGICQLYYNTDGGRSGKGLIKDKFQFE